MRNWLRKPRPAPAGTCTSGRLRPCSARAARTRPWPWSASSPGDQEDKQGHPFVGPAGHLLDRALRESGIERADAYVTNAVKHFKWEARGKRRIHQRPNGTEIMAFRGWLEAELAAVGPRVTVALGAVAGEALFGRLRVTGSKPGGPVSLRTAGRRSGGAAHPAAG